MIARHVRYGRAGVPADPAEAAKRAAGIRARINRDRADREARMAQARRMWERGALRPYLITMALDLRGLEGPEVDVACLAEEPDVDDWEAGFKYPSWEQFLALCELTDIKPWWFTMPHRPEVGDQSSIRFHQPDWTPPAPPVLRFSPAAIREQLPDYLPEGPPE